jgi:hypothetical protein
VVKKLVKPEENIRQHPILNMVKKLKLKPKENLRENQTKK